MAQGDVLGEVIHQLANGASHDIKAPTAGEGKVHNILAEAACTILIVDQATGFVTIYDAPTAAKTIENMQVSITDGAGAKTSIFMRITNTSGGAANFAWTGMATK